MTDGNRIPGRIVRDDRVPPGKPWDGIVRKGQILRIVDLEGRQGVDFLCYSAADPQERYHMPNTLKAARTLKLGLGHVLYSDVARPIFTIVGDSCGGHDTIGGCCSGPSNEMLYGVRDCPGCRENFLAGLGRHGLGRKDIVANINFFCEVPVDAERRLADTVFVPGHSKPGDYVDLRAEMDALALVSNCPQVNNPCNEGRPKPIRIAIWER
jgi:urea carboxylase-associated protein 1